MTSPGWYSSEEAAIVVALTDATTINKGGFVVVRWFDQYYYLPTRTPHLELDLIVGATTSGIVVGRFKRTVDGWEEILLERAVGEYL